MTFGRKVEKGFLPVFAVADEDEARDLIVLACERNLHGEHIARELAHKQTLENLEAFSTRLDQAHDRLVQAGKCRCGGTQ